MLGQRRINVGCVQLNYQQTRDDKTNVDVIFGQRCRRWANVASTLDIIFLNNKYVYCKISIVLKLSSAWDFDASSGVLAGVHEYSL